tara:strand:+ start:671 stop:1390 length:720 start_codon:yes stop_codon:yes gene_type:complete
MKSIYFISDIHLDPNNSKVTKKFIEFMNNKSSDMKELYILGDLFEFWIDDKYDIIQNNLIISTLKKISENGTKIFLMHGNRDFLVGKKFTKITNIQILPENYILNLNETKILITHGDLLCTDDVDYQKFRRFIRNKLTLKIFNLLSNNIKIKIASYLRGKSKKITSQKPENIMDVNEKEVLNFYERFGTDIIIHGHTHRKSIHKTRNNGTNYTRYVLGDWHNAPSYIIFKNNKISLFDV